VNQLPLAEVLIRLGVAAFVGGLLGFNRELHRKPAGLRTLSMVSLGAAIAALGSVEFFGAEPDTVSRVSQGVLTGIGFIGAGVIMRVEQAGSVTGLTTAAAIWVVAGLGYASGLGEWRLALGGAVIALMILVLGERVEDAMRPWVERRNKD
jgi:putative Mg2+ transporter-C (MgtC) family protein